MRRLLLIALIALPAAAEWLSFEIRFQPSGCVSCTQSLPERVKRMRGVESAEVDTERSILKMKLAPGNRVRIELVRDQIEQDGTKALSARLEGIGSIAREGAGYVFRPAALPLSYAIEIAGTVKVPNSDGSLRVIAEATALRPAPALRLIESSPATAQ
jgi:hypothetical protein